MLLMYLIPVQYFINIKNVYWLIFFVIDGSGSISDREMGNIFKALNVKVDNNQLKKLIKEMDSDGSGMYEKI